MRKKIKAGDNVCISFSKIAEPEILDWLNKQKNLSKSINELIRKEVIGSGDSKELWSEIEKIKVELEKLKGSSCDKKDLSEVAIPDSQIVEYPEEEKLWD